MSPYRRITVNTLATYIRCVFSLGLAIFSSRWVLNALGVTDMGLFGVVGSMIVFITFINAILASSVGRFFAYYNGQGDFAEVKCWFNAALCIHLCMAFLLILLGWPIGEYFIMHILTIPYERVTACLWVFRISLFSAFINMLSVPFVAMFTAKQHISELAVWGVIQSSMTFTLAWILRNITGDRLMFYATCMAGILVFVQLAQIFRAMFIFDECSIACHQSFDLRKLKEIFSFAIWNLIGSSGVVVRDQGSAILLNLFFGANVNAAYSIASQVSMQTNQLSTSMIGAFAPEINASEGRNDRANMISLSQSAGKFATILVLFFAIPLIVEMDYVLKLWLQVPPPYTAIFCQLILGTFLIDRLGTGYMLASQAHGKNEAYQVIVGTSFLLTLPLAWFFLKSGLAPTSIGIAFIVMILVTTLGRVLWGRKVLGISIRSWLTTVVCPNAIVAIISMFAAMITCWLLPPSILRLALVIVTSILVSLPTMWFFVFNHKERDFVMLNVHYILDGTFNKK